MNPHNELIRLAAEMARGIGLPSEYPEDRKFCKTTPIAERRRIIKEAELARETAKVWALRVRAVADLLAADQPSARLSCPVCHTSVLGVSGDGMIACGRIDCPAVTVQPTGGEK